MPTQNRLDTLFSSPTPPPPKKKKKKTEEEEVIRIWRVVVNGWSYIFLVDTVENSRLFSRGHCIGIFYGGEEEIYGRRDTTVSLLTVTKGPQENSRSCYSCTTQTNSQDGQSLGCLPWQRNISSHPKMSKSKNCCLCVSCARSIDGFFLPTKYWPQQRRHCRLIN